MVVERRIHLPISLPLGLMLGAIALAQNSPALAGEPFLAARSDPRTAVDWKLIQRSSASGANVPVKIFYRLDESGRVQARVTLSSTGQTLPGQDFVDNDWPVSANVGTTANFPLSEVPTGGNYDIHLQLLRDSDNAVVGTADILQIAVGDVYLAGGQSNMSGFSIFLDDAETPIDQVHLFGNDYVWKQASEPMDDGSGQLDTVSLDFPQHSLMLRFAKDVVAATGVPVGIIPGPLGGSNLVDQWQRDSRDPDNRNTLYGSLLYRYRLHAHGAPPAGFLWFQGESDAGTVAPGYYRTLLQGLIEDYRTDLAHPQLPFVVAQLGTYTFSWLPGWLAVQEAQRQVARSDVHVALTTTVDQPTIDTIHYTTDAYKVIGSRFAAAALEQIYAQNVDSLTELTDIALGQDLSSIVLTYDATVAIAGEPSLYLVQDAAGRAMVTSTNANNNQITLSLARAVAGNPVLTYGTSRLFSSQWAIDANARALPVFRFVSAGPQNRHGSPASNARQ